MIAGPGVADRLADDDEDARADDRAEAERGEVERADDALELVSRSSVSRDERVDGLRGEQPVTLCAMLVLLTRGRDDQDRAARALEQLERDAAEQLRRDAAAARRAADDHVGLALLREDEDPARDATRPDGSGRVDAVRGEPRQRRVDGLARERRELVARHRRERLHLDARRCSRRRRRLPSAWRAGRPRRPATAARSRPSPRPRCAACCLPRPPLTLPGQLPRRAVGPNPRRVSVRRLPYC